MSYLPVDILVNKEFGVDINYEPNDLVITDENKNNFHNFLDPNEKPMVSLDIYPAYKKLEYASMKDGFHIVVGSGFRSGAYQVRIFRSVLEKYYNEYKKIYKDASESQLYRMAFDKTKNLVAQPGHSEHQTGFAFDAAFYRGSQFFDTFSNTEEARWMYENASKYGFILRYPKGKENITGYNYEPWHFRYVGADISNEMYSNGEWITLEEHSRGLRLK